MEILAHKMVLAAASPYFYAMFSGSDFEESHQDRITVQGVDYRALELLIEYVYTSYVDVTEENVQVFTIFCHVSDIYPVKLLAKSFILFIPDPFDGGKPTAID